MYRDVAWEELVNTQANKGMLNQEIAEKHEYTETNRLKHYSPLIIID